MKFKRLSDDKLQIIVSKDDLADRNMKKWDLMPYSPMAQELFQDILQQAYDECGFEVAQDAQLMVEAYPMTGESLLITVTKVDNLESDLFNLGIEQEDDDFFADWLESDQITPLINEEAIYLFYELEDAIEVAALIHEQYTGDSVLYKHKERYFLLILNSVNLSDTSYGFLAEYADSSQISSAYLKEHAQVIIEKEALKILAKIAGK